MFQKGLHILFAISIISTTLYSQNDVRNFTLSIVDTLDGEYEQATDIYNWITSNIKYDLKKYEKFDNSIRSASEMLKVKKGVCYDYANLFWEMCNSIGIEAYVINGYSKGYQYYPGMPFLKANHSWNIINVDSEWIICDATWGSGFITQKPGFFNKALYITTRTAFTNNKLLFEQTTFNNYFDVKAEDMIYTHYPLDPKWMLSAYPFSFEYFNGDSAEMNFDLPYYEKRIEEIRGTSEINQFKVEGVSAQKHNPLNHFNIAYSYYQAASLYDIERDIQPDNLWQFEKYYNEYSLVYESINKHKAITDSVYRSRFKSLKVLASDQKGLTNRIKSKTKSAKKSFQSKQKQITGKNSSYDKKLGNYIVNIGRTELKYLKPAELIPDALTDSTEINKLKNQISALEEQEPEFKKILDSLLTEVELRISDDAHLDDSIITKNTLFNTEIISLEHMILSNDEVIIRQYVDTLKIVYSDIVGFLTDKKQSKKDVEAIGRLHYSFSAELQKNLKQQVALLNKAARMANYPDELINRNNQAVKRLIKSYNESIDFTRILANHNSNQKDIRKQNLVALKQQRKSISKEYSFFIAWYNHINKLEKERYENEKLVLKTIRSSSQKSRKVVEMKIKNYKTNIK